METENDLTSTQVSDIVGDETQSTEYNNPRVIPMQCGDDESYTLLFYEKENAVYVDIYDSVSKKLVQTIKSPFPVGGIQGINHCQSFDVMFFAQADTHPCKLKREKKENDDGVSEYVFSFENNTFLPEPILDWDTKSEHTVSVFAIPDEDLLVENVAGEKVFPAGVCREIIRSETLSFSYSYSTSYWKSVPTDGYGSYGKGYFTVAYKIYAFSAADYFSSYKKGNPVKFSTPITVKTSDFSYEKDREKGTVKIHTAQHYDGGQTTFTTNSATFYSGIIEKVGNNGVFIYVGEIHWKFYLGLLYYGKPDYFVKIEHLESGIATVKYGDNQFYVTIIDNVPQGVDVSDVIYYKPVSGKDFTVAMTIDGTNKNENIEVGQIIAVQKKQTVYISENWDYENIPIGTKSTTAIPAVEVLEPLASKKDDLGGELRPQSGGGYGFASDWIPYRGTVELKTNGVWSGIIELQELDASGDISAIATISSENGLSNTSLERDISEFGSCIRVACTRREYAFEKRQSIKGDGSVVSNVIKVDTGCQWALSSSDVTTAYLRIEEKKTLSTGVDAYIVKVIGGVGGSFSSNTYALGAWSKKNGYPSQVGIFQERLMYGCNKQKPTTLWLSRTNNWEDFELGTDDTSAMSFTMQTEKYDKIRWTLVTKSYVSIGTDYSEWIFGDSNGGVVTPTNGRFVNTSNIGNEAITAQQLGTALIMVKTGGKEIHRIDYNTLSEESAGTQVSMLARHLFEDDEIKDMFSIKSPTNMLYVLCKSGKLVSFTYEPDYGVSGWARHEILDGVVCATTVRRSGKDVLVFVVKKGERYLLGEIESGSDVWTDDGENYESELVPMPMSPASGAGTYGNKVVFAGVDIYSTDATRYYARLNGGAWERVDRGFDTSGTLPKFGEMKRTLSAGAGWADEALVEIKTDYPAPLVISGVGASVNVSNITRI